MMKRLAPGAAALWLAMSAHVHAQPAALPPPLDGGGPPPMACLIEPYMVSELGSPIAGVIDRITVQRGDTVRKGDVVATLDGRVDEATLKLRRAEADFLDRTVKRNEDLYQRKLIPDSEYDEVSSKSRVAGLQVEQQQATVGERVIRAPFDGVVAERYAGLGDRVSDNKIMKLAQINPLLVKVVVPEGLYGKIKQNAQVDVTINPALSAKPLQATVWRIDKVIDAASATFVVLLKMDNKDNRIPAGIRCSVRLP